MPGRSTAPPGSNPQASLRSTVAEVVEGLGGRFDSLSTGRHFGPQPRLRPRVETRRFPIALGHLLRRFFGNIEASLAARARIEAANGASTSDGEFEVDGALPDGPILEATLEDRGDDWRYTLNLDDTNLTTTHERYLAPLFEDQLGRLELGGKLAVRVHGDYRNPSSPLPKSLH